MTANYIAAALGGIFIAVAIFGRGISVTSFSFLGIVFTVDGPKTPRRLSHGIRAFLGVLGGALMAAALLAGAGIGWERIGGWIGPAQRTLTITTSCASAGWAAAARSS